MLPVLFLCLDTGHDQTLNTVIMPMVDNNMCSRIKGKAGESRICAGGKRGEGVCDVRISKWCLLLNSWLRNCSVVQMWQKST